MIRVERAYPRAWQASACLCEGSGRMTVVDWRLLIFEGWNAGECWTVLGKSDSFALHDLAEGGRSLGGED